MPEALPAARDFRRKIRERVHVLGTFIKIPTSHTMEIVGLTGFDFAIVDQEHGASDRSALDIACFAARAANIAAIVRVTELNAAAIMTALDCGAAGVVVPHCHSLENAHAAAAACRHRGGARGFATTTRAGAYGGIPGLDHIAQRDDAATCIVMIENAAALDHLDEIVAVRGIDAVFIGRGDLGAVLGPDETKAAAIKIAAAAKAAGMPVIALVASRDDARAMRELGVSAFLFSNDQNLLKSAATQAVMDYRDPAAW